MQTHDEPSRENVRRPAIAAGALLLLLALPLLWIYAQGLTSHAPKWEEPRRCMVAVEMIQRGDYIVPRVMGEIYRNKPPLYDWMIAAAAGLDAGAVSAGHGRALSLAALAGIAVLLALAGTSERRGTDWLPALMVPGFALVIQNGRAGETDVVFCLLLTAAVVCFDVGRRRDSPWIQWTLSQALVGLGAMTKGLSPLFFYPPILWLAFRRPAVYRPRLLPMLAGAAAMAGVMALWLVPYGRLAPVGDLQSRWLDEVLKLYVRPGWGGTLRHLLTYPLMLFLVAAPWSFFAVGLPGAERRARIAEVARDPWVRLCWTVAAWIALVYLVVPGVRARYLMPMLPFLSIVLAALVRSWESRPAGGGPALRAGIGSRILLWILPVLGIVTIAVTGRDLFPTHPGALLTAVGVILVSTIVVGRQWSREATASPLLPLLLLGLVYGAFFVGVSETERHVRYRVYADAGRALAGHIDDATPVVCDCHDTSGRKLAFALMQTLDRHLEGREYPGPHYRVTREESPPEAAAQPVDTAAGFTLWRVGPRAGDTRLTPPEASEIMRPTPH